jgi:hypothetical protein
MYFRVIFPEMLLPFLQPGEFVVFQILKLYISYVSFADEQCINKTILFENYDIKSKITITTNMD